MSKNKYLRAAIIIICSIVILPIALFMLDVILFKDKVHARVFIEESYFGNMNVNDARGKLDSLAESLETVPIVLYWDETSWEVKPAADLKVSVDRKKAIDEAYSVGRKGSIFKQFRERVAVWKKPKKIKLKISADKDKTDNLINTLAKSIDQPALDPMVVIKDEKAVAVQGRTGLLLTREEAVNTIKKTIASKDKRRNRLNIVVVPTSVKFAKAKKAAEQANIMFSAPLTLKYGESSWQIDEKTIMSHLVFTKNDSPDGKTIIPEFDKEKTKVLLEKTTNGITREPKDAEFKVSGDKVIIIPSQEGLNINHDSAIVSANKSSLGKKTQDREVLLTSTVTQPKLTTEKAQAMGVKEKIASYTTTYSPNAASRVSNIHLLTKSLDGTMVAPGENFSFNKSIGPRTADKGYKEASVIVSGKLVPGLGGGVCQVATTMFNTIFFSGLPVSQRRNHSFYISKYPTGRDATVSYPYPDLQFKNDTGSYILIKGYYSSSSVTISFYGTNPGRTVNYSTTGFSNFQDFPIEKIEDPTLDEGVEKIYDAGEQGKQVTVYRTVKKDGVELFKDTFVSKYRPKIQVVKYGTKPVEAQPVSTPTSSAEQNP